MPYVFMVRQALTAAAANAAINGLKAWITLRRESQLALTLDSISGGSETVFGSAVASAFGLGLAVTGMTYLTFRSSARKQGVALVPGLSFWPMFALLMLKNAVFAFGVLVVAAVLFHRAFGVVEVSGAAASLITAAIAFLVVFYTALDTMRSMIRKGADQ